MTPVDAAKWQHYKEQALASAPVDDHHERQLEWVGQILTFTEQWADRMETAIAQGSSVADCAESTSFEVNEGFDDGLTLFMYQNAVMNLVWFWIHGDELRQWHNERFRPRDWRRSAPSEGILDCAVVATPLGKAAIIADYTVVRDGMDLYWDLRTRAGAEALMRMIEQHYKERVQPSERAYRWWMGGEIAHHCPNCGVHVPATTPVDGPEHVPKPGDVSICVHCAAVMRFSAKLGLELLSAEDLRCLLEEDAGEFLHIGSAWWAVRAKSIHQIRGELARRAGGTNGFTASQ